MSDSKKSAPLTRNSVRRNGIAPRAAFRFVQSALTIKEWEVASQIRSALDGVSKWAQQKGARRSAALHAQEMAILRAQRDNAIVRQARAESEWSAVYDDAEKLRANIECFIADVERLTKERDEALTSLRSLRFRFDDCKEKSETKGAAEERARIVAFLRKTPDESVPARFVAAIIEAGLHAKDGAK